MNSKSIEQLENYIWIESQYLSSNMSECNLYRKIPIEDLSLENLLHLLQHNVGTAYLLSRALDILEKEPLIMGDYYEGDLLVSLITLPNNELQRHGQLIDKLLEITSKIGKAKKIVKKPLKAFKEIYA